MPRSLPAGLAAAVATNRAHNRRLLHVDAGGVEYFWAEETLTFGGNDYEPRLAVTGSIKQRRSLQVDTAEVGVENATLFFSRLVETVTLEGATARLWLLNRDSGEAILTFTGVVASWAAQRPVAKLRLTAGFDPAQKRLPNRFYSALCPWRFKSLECGYVGALETCEKTIAQCVERGQRRRFGGFVHLTRAVQQSVTPKPADLEDFGGLDDGGFEEES